MPDEQHLVNVNNVKMLSYFNHRKSFVQHLWVVFVKWAGKICLLQTHKTLTHENSPRLETLLRGNAHMGHAFTSVIIKDP